jgi:hypothetical protein
MGRKFELKCRSQMRLPKHNLILLRGLLNPVDVEENNKTSMKKLKNEKTPIPNFSNDSAEFPQDNSR